MKFTYEEMKEQFKIRFVKDSTYHSNLDLVEVFVANDTEESFKTIEEAKNKLLEDCEKRYLEELKKLEKIKDNFEKVKKEKFISYIVFMLINKNLSFYKIYEQKLNEAIEDRKNALLDIEKMNIVYLDKNKLYDVPYPEIKEGDAIYVSVIKKNHLDVGVHKLTLNGIRRLEERFYAKAVYQGVGAKDFNNDFDFGEECQYCLRIEGVEGNLSTGYAYHEAFFNRKDAEEYLNKELDKQIAILEGRKIKNPS